MTVSRQAHELGDAFKGVGPERLTHSLLKNRYIFEPFGQEPSASKKGAVYAAPAGTSLQEQYIDTGLHRLEYSFLGDATDAFVPTLATDGGYNWASIATLTLNRGLEVCFGGTTAGHPRNFVPRSEDWFARVLLSIDDASGADITLGFKKAATPVLTLTEVTDIAGVRILGDASSALAALSVVTNLNNAGSTDYSSSAIANTLTDGQYIELEVRAVAGKAQFFVNGVRVASTVSYTFDSGDVCAPVLRILQASDIAAEVKTFAYEAGPLKDRNPANLVTLAFATA